MNSMLLSKLLKHTHATVRNDCEIEDLTMDSRMATAGAAFFAVQGTEQHGVQFVRQAVANGAAAIVHDGLHSLPEDLSRSMGVAQVECLRERLGGLAAQFFETQRDNQRCVAFTGTNGKTSCVTNFSTLANRCGLSCGVIGTLGWGVQDRLASTGLTTPDVFTVHRIVKSMREQGCEVVALEASSHALEQGRLDGLKINTAVFTNISRDHLDFHQSMDSYANAKARLFQRRELSNAVVNIDADYSQLMMQLATGHAQVLSYSMRDASADVYADNIEFRGSGSCFDLRTPWGSHHIILNQIGRFNIANLLAVVSALCVEGQPFRSVIDKVSELGTVPGRMQLVHANSDLVPRTIVDYAHTPDALDQVLIAAAAHCSGELWLVFGCGGDRDRGKRAEMAAVAQNRAARIVVTSDNPRSEDPEQIISDIVAGFTVGGFGEDAIHIEADRKSAIEWAINAAAPGDCLVIAGKGHEKFQILGDQKLPFDDVLIAESALRRRMERGL